MKKDNENLAAPLLYIMLLGWLVLPNIVLSFTEGMNAAMAIANVFLPLGLLGVLGAISSNISRTVWYMMPLILIAIFQLVLLVLFGRSIIAVDMLLNLVTSNPNEAGELMGNLWPVIASASLLYAPLIIYAVVAQRKKKYLSVQQRRYGMRASASTLGIGIAAILICYITTPAYSMLRDIYPINVGYNCWLAYSHTNKMARYEEKAKSYRYGAKCERDDSIREICVLVVGETSRSDNWQLLGYPRATNPALSKRGADIIAASHAMSESNTTHKAVPMMLSPVNAENFHTDIYEARSLITAFREAGWHTAFISDQGISNSLIDHYGAEADTTIYTRQHQGDFPMLDDIKSIISAKRRKQLIVVHSYGSHFSYKDRYGAIDRVFTPDDYTDPYPGERSKLINAYDNSIVATDRFLDSIISMLEKEECVASMFYSSDHGEDIYDDGRHILHACPVPSQEQVRVAMLAWLSPQYRSAFPQIEEAMRTNFEELISSSRSFCPTAFGLCGITTKKTAGTDAISALTSSRYTPRTPLYLNDHNEGVQLSEIVR